MTVEDPRGYKIVTNTGSLVNRKTPPYTLAQAEASVRDRNQRAEALDIEARYALAVEDGQ